LETNESNSFDIQIDYNLYRTDIIDKLTNEQGQENSCFF